MMGKVLILLLVEIKKSGEKFSTELVGKTKAEKKSNLEKYTAERWGVSDDKIDIGNADPKAMAECFSKIDGVITDHPELADRLANGGIFVASASDMRMMTGSSDSVAFSDGNGVAFNQKFWGAERERVDPNGFHVQNSVQSDTATHEMAHILERDLARKMGMSPQEEAQAMRTQQLSRQMVNDALVSTSSTDAEIIRGVKNSSPRERRGWSDSDAISFFNNASSEQQNAMRTVSISRYASAKPSETFAEAFTDVRVNGNNANSLSQAIMQEYRRLAGGLMLNIPQFIDKGYDSFDESSQIFNAVPLADAPNWVHEEYGELKKTLSKDNNAGVRAF